MIFKDLLSISSKKFLKPLKRGNQRAVRLYHKGKSHTMLIHRVVTEVFIPNPNNLSCVIHKNGNNLDNSVKNLEWSTSSNACKQGHTRRKIITRPVVQFKLDEVLDEIARFSSISEAAKRTHVSTYIIQRNCDDNNFIPEKTTFRWRYQNEEHASKKRFRGVIQYTVAKTTERIIKRFESAKDAGDAVQTKSGNILSACRGGGTSRGFFWRY